MNEPTSGSPAGPASPAPNAPSSALLDHVETRAHGAGNVGVDATLLQRPLMEAPVGVANASQEEDIFQVEIDRARAGKESAAGGPSGPGGPPPRSGGGKGGGAAPKGGPSKDYSNPDLKGLSPEKSREAAENLAKLILQGYARVTDFADQQLQVSEKKMLKIRTAGRIDMETPIPIEGGMVSFEEFIRTYNQQTKGTLAVEPEFIEDVLPRLTSVLAKRGQGLSDEQYLLGAFGAHIGINAQKFFAMQSTLRQFMNFGMEMTKRNREDGVQYTGPAPSPAYTPPPPQPAPAPEPAPAPVVPMYEQQMNGGAAQEYSLPEWGGKEKQAALKKAAKKGQAAAGKKGISVEAPASRRKIRRKNQAS